MAVDTDLTWTGDAKKKDMNDSMIRFLTRGTIVVQSDAKLKAAEDTGNLRGSIVRTVKEQELKGTVSTNVEYAPYVEFGLRKNPNYPKQPFLRPALKNNLGVLRKIAISEGVKGVNK